MGKITKAKAILEPERFGCDSLSYFLSIAQNNTYANFTDKNEEYQNLLHIDDSFRILIKNISKQEDGILGLFLLRCHSVFLNASRLVLSGATAETFILLRSVIEVALYSLHIDSEEDRWMIWLNRHLDDASFSACKKELTYSRVLRTLNSLDTGLGNKVNELYQLTIDFGAHPNERAITSNLKLENKDSEIRFQIDYLNGNNLSTAHALKTTIEVGVVALSIFELMRKERFQILDISDTLERLRLRLRSS